MKFLILMLAVIISTILCKQKINHSREDVTARLPGTLSYLLGEKSTSGSVFKDIQLFIEDKKFDQAYQLILPIYKEKRDEVKQEIDKRAILYQESLKLMKNMTSEERYQIPFQKSFLKEQVYLDESNQDFIEKFEILETIIGKKQLEVNMLQASNDLNAKLIKNQKPYEKTSQEWARLYPRFLYRQITKSVKDESQVFLSHTVVIESLNGFIEKDLERERKLEAKRQDRAQKRKKQQQQQNEEL